MTNEPSRPLDIKGSEKYKRVFTEIYRDKVFFSRIKLEDKLGVEYEPYIFAALNSAKIMLVGDSYSDNGALMDASTISSTVSMVIAQEIAIMMCIMICTTAATTSSH